MWLFSFLPHVDAQPGWRRSRNGCGVSLLSKLGMPEDHFVGTNRNLRIPHRRLSKLLAIQPHVGPGRSVNRDRALRPIRLDVCDLAGSNLNRLRRAVTERVVDELD